MKSTTTVIIEKIINKVNFEDDDDWLLSTKFVWLLVIFTCIFGLRHLWFWGWWWLVPI